MITKDEIQELLHSTETYRVERTTSTDERSKSRGQTRLDYALQGGRRREPTGDMDKFQEAIFAFVWFAYKGLLDTEGLRQWR